MGASKSAYEAPPLTPANRIEITFEYCRKRSIIVMIPFRMIDRDIKTVAIYLKCWSAALLLVSHNRAPMHLPELGTYSDFKLSPVNTHVNGKRSLGGDNEIIKLRYVIDYKQTLWNG